MAGKKRGLGRGLDALLDPYVETASEQRPSVLEVDIRSIDTNAQQPRKQFEEEALKELAASIATHGIVQPLIVKEQNGRYLIVAGERRFRAARMAKLSTVPVLVVDYDDAKMHEVSLIENIQREDLNPIEEAAAIRFLMQQHDMTQEEVSERIGKSRPAVANALRLCSCLSRCSRWCETVRFLRDTAARWQAYRTGKCRKNWPMNVCGLGIPCARWRVGSKTLWRTGRKRGKRPSLYPQSLATLRIVSASASEQRLRFPAPRERGKLLLSITPLRICSTFTRVL